MRSLRGRHLTADFLGPQGDHKRGLGALCLIVSRWWVGKEGMAGEGLGGPQGAELAHLSLGVKVRPGG